MSEVLITNDGKVITLRSPHDLEELIEKYIGPDFAKSYHRQIEELSDCVRELDNYVDDVDIHSEVREVLLVNGFQ